VNPPFASTVRRLAPIVLAAWLAGCTSTSGLLSGDKIDYYSGAAKTRPLEIPPDLTQLARDPRYAPQGGVVSASAVQSAPAAGTLATTTASIAPTTMGRARIERQGGQRWLVVEAATPETLWPDIRAFWIERGFTLTTDNAQAGLIETDWAENRAKLPNDFIRSMLGRAIDRVYDTGERDRFRTRVERTAAGTEIYLSHRGLEEVYSSERRDHTVWIPRASDPQLEAEILTRLMVRLGAKEETARTLVTTAPEAPARARLIGADGALAALEVDEPFDRAWRRVGLALDRGGFSVEDRDRTAGLYFVRYIDPKYAGKDEPGFFGRLFSFGSRADEIKPVRYRVQVKGSGDKSTVSVLNASGAPETGDPGKSIVASLVRELR
jgi:outer membrane protein assembly factor BamC